jgi:NhaA family Na+:H+ antiporter
LPFFAALGGMLIPALIYLSIAGDSYSSGWAIPVATDIALAVGVLGLIGSKSISILRPFLLGLAVIDDIGAILIIAVFFSVGVNFSWLLAAGVLVLIVVLTKYLDIRFTTVYVFLGIILWLCFYKSGVTILSVNLTAIYSLLNCEVLLAYRLDSEICGVAL